MAFQDRFHSLTGHAPFPWQERLHSRFLAGTAALPRALDLPTGLGKTSVMAIWLLALADGAAIPRRLIYVVDRRAVVDQASRIARDLSAASLTGVERLVVSTLRGNLADDGRWLNDPSAPALVVGTVDMIGSRLLFSGYGVSRGMRPFHAGFLGTDTLVVLDEAHLSRPFAALLERVETLGGGAVRITALSATGEIAPDFALDADDLADATVVRRVRAEKALTFAATIDAKSIASEALALVADRPARVAVFVTSREMAAKVAGELAKAKMAPILLVGERRVFEREAVAADLEAAGFTGDAGEAAVPAFVVATAAGEVGIDLDADHAVMDIVAYERMVQRLGRVNRRGGRSARVVVVDPGPPKDAGEAERRERTRALLAGLPDGGDGPIASPNNLAALRAADPEAVRAASTPPPLHPPLTTPLVEAWAMTSLEQHTGRPDVGPWLRGWVDEEPQTTVVWRTHLPVLKIDEADADVDDPGAVEAFFAAAPPHLTEGLEAETVHVADWLAGKRGSVGRRLRDAKGHDGLRWHQVVALVLTPSLDLHLALTLGDIAGPSRIDFVREFAGRTLVLDAALAGLSRGLLDAAITEPPVTADAGPWLLGGTSIAPFCVVEHAPDEAPTGRIVHRMVVQRTTGGEPRRVLSIVALGDAAPSEHARSVAQKEVTLVDHSADVVREAERILGRLALPEEEMAAILLAADLHDAGKASTVWQKAMRARPGGPWAKTTGGDGRALGGYRHEFGSLLAAQAAPRVTALPEAMADLVLHLVAAHHGRARPLLPTDGCQDGPPSALAAHAGAAALRYARLSARYGAWGLAYREAILRAADQRASRDAGDGA